MAALNDVFRKMAKLLPIITRHQLHCLRRSMLHVSPGFNLGLETVRAFASIARALGAKSAEIGMIGLSIASCSYEGKHLTCSVAHDAGRVKH